MFVHLLRQIYVQFGFGEKLASIIPGHLNKAFFTLSGAESNENAIILARLYSGSIKS